MTGEQGELLERVIKRHGCDLEPLYYISDDRGEELDCGESSFCFDHACIVARWESREQGVEYHLARSWGETDHAHVECAFGDCGKLLRADGGITSYGVDSALALTEEDPFKACVSPEELDLAACAMMPNDPRWATWERQARRLLRQRPRKR